jgi:Ni/Co efflux regulator RcnB
MAAMVLSLAAGSVAFADPPQDHDRDHHDNQHQMAAHHAMHDTHARFMTGHYVRPHGYHSHSWRRGERLPPAYRGATYVIPSPAIYHLRPPPAGYYWVRVDNNAVLAAVATGVVVDVALNLFH